MSRLRALFSFAAIFAALQLGRSVYQAMYYGVELSWSSFVLGTLIVCAAGTLGYLTGSLMVGRDYHFRTIVFIALLGYFVSYSITHLLESVFTSPWVLMISLFAVTMAVTVKIGPKWEEGAGQKKGRK